MSMTDPDCELSTGNKAVLGALGTCFTLTVVLALLIVVGFVRKLLLWLWG